MASFTPYFHQDPSILHPQQLLQPPPPPPPPPPQPLAQPPTISDTKEAPSGMVATLLVRHLPEGVPHDMLSRMFSHYGAACVRPCAGGRLRNCAFVDFKDESLASQAQSQLNRLRFLGKVITVDRADKATSKSKYPQSALESLKDASCSSASSLNDNSVQSKSFQPCSEPIALRLGVEYPFPPHLEYAYPPPDGNILTNIVNALIAVPRFYTQVLHLMNKMNLPAPFRMALPTPPLPPPIPAPPPPPPPVTAKPQVADLSSDESELESSEEDADETRAHKRAKRAAIVGPAVDKGVMHEAVGLKPAALVPKEVPLIKKKNPVLQIKITPKSQKEAAEDESMIRDPMEPAKEEKTYLTPEELQKGKIPPEEILSLPMFKNYAAGNPSTVLYIKNLAKDVVVDDFYFIFGSLFESVDAAKSNLHIKLMQEGRMRGQAFVTFPTVDLAHRSLNIANGFLFKGKPIIIQFGRNPSASKTNNE